MTSYANHPFHLVDQGSWPLTGAIGAIIIITGLIKWFHQFNNELIFIGLSVIILTIIQWRRDIFLEGRYQWLHTKFVTKGLLWGIILFIISEVFFFFFFFFLGILS